MGHAGRRTFQADSEEEADPREPGAARSQVAAVGWEWGYGGAGGRQRGEKAGEDRHVTLLDQSRDSVLTLETGAVGEEQGSRDLICPVKGLLPAELMGTEGLGDQSGGYCTTQTQDGGDTGQGGDRGVVTSGRILATCQADVAC